MVSAVWPACWWAGRRWFRVGTFPLVTIILSILIGGVTFTGSMIAYGKLSERIGSGAVLFSGQQVVNSLIVLGILAGAVMFCLQPDNHLCGSTWWSPVAGIRCDGGHPPSAAPICRW